MTDDELDFVLIGLLRRAHGVAGEVCVEPVSDMAERFDVLNYVLVATKDGTTEIGVDSVRWKGRFVLLKLDGVDDRTSAEALAGARLGVRRQDVYPLPEDTYYVFDLIGCKVIGESGREIGVVDDVMRTPANDVFALKTEAGEVLIPAVKSIVKSIDLEARIMVIEEMEGLLD